MIPGALRDRDVKVGHHVPVSPGALPRFLERFEAAYTGLGRTDSILAAAAAHHRLLWIHPFLDGNGRVARLMSHAMLLESLDTGGVWSVARGLARNEETYKAQLMACDARRRNDLDGRGHLSEEALAAFTRFFLRTCIDQVDFMEGLVQPDRSAQPHPDLGRGGDQGRRPATEIRRRSPGHSSIVASCLGGRSPSYWALGERQARRVTAALIGRDILAFRQLARAAPPRLPRPARLALAAGAVPRQRGMISTVVAMARAQVTITLQYFASVD